MQQTSATPAPSGVARSAPEAVPRASKVEAYNLADLRQLAKRVLPKGLFEFVDRGTEKAFTGSPDLGLLNRDLLHLASSASFTSSSSSATAQDRL